MFVLHGTWLSDGGLACWGEHDGGPAQAAVGGSARRGRRPGRDRARGHPFAADPDALAALLGDRATGARPGSVTLLLPTVGDVPCASPELGLVDPPARRKVTVTGWVVPVLRYDPDAALPVLLALREVGSADRGTGVDALLGADLRHLVAVAAFAVDLVSRGRLLPAVSVCPGDVGEARWLPLLTGADAAAVRSLVGALPPVGRAELVDGAGSVDGVGSADGAGSVDGVDVVAGAVDCLVDAAARVALDGVRLAPTRRIKGAGEAVRPWLTALTGRRRTFPAGRDALLALAAELAAWQRDAAGGEVRACFRLIEPPEPPEPPEPAEPAELPEPAGSVPPEPDPAWRIEFALQATDEPSLVVDAEQVWRSPAGLTALARHFDDPHERLLAELGRASRLWPELEAALRAARPAAMDLDTAGAHHFLAERAPLLAAAGFGVLLPAWWSRSNRRLGVRLSAGTPGGGRTAPGTVARPSGFGLDALVDYRWQLALGDEPLDEAELRALAGLKAPLVRLRGQWVELDPARLAAGLKLLRAGGTMTVGELLRTGLAAEEGPGGLPVVGVDATGVLGDLLSGRVEQRLAPVDEPAGFRGRLRPYQRRGLAWLAFLQSLGLGGVLADDMGLGKTVQVLALVAADAPDAGPTLLVCPMSLVGNWQREAARFVPDLRVHVHHGAERVRGDEFVDVVRESDLVLTTYALAARDADALRAVGWHRLVIDEAQAIKNAATRQSTAVRAIPAGHRIALTGTPVENRLADLWSIMEFTNPGLLGTAATFRRRYAEPVERRGDEQAAARLKRITTPFVLRRVKTDRSIISDLPEKLEMEVVCNLTAEQASLYQAVVDDALARIETSEGIERRGLVLATMTRLKQVCNHPAQLLHDGTRLAGRSGKLARLEEILEEVLAAGERALLFTQYAEFGAALRGHLAARFDREVLFLHGGVAKTGRDAMVERFQAAGTGGPAIFVLSLKAGGTGLTLTAANHVVHFDRWWNPAVEDQATDRAFRIGQRRAVQVRKFVCAGTLEEKISEMIKEKRGLAERIVGTGEQWLTELSTAQLRELLTLDAGAVVE